MSADAKTILTMPGDTEIVLDRTFDAPRELVWKVWTDPAHVVNWWGPVGFTTTTRRMEVKPGGQWRFVMRGPDGREYENLITFTEVTEPDRLAYKHGGEKDLEPVSFRVTVTFERVGAAGNQTRLTMRMMFPSKAARDFVIKEYNAAEGGKQTVARLGEYVERLRSAGGARDADQAFVLNRVFDAPRDLMWRVWTQAEHLARWFGPKGVTLPKVTLDLRVGGAFHYCMRMPDGTEHWGKWVFREITPPDRMIFVVSFADAAGNPVRAPFDASWPLETLSTITFADHAGRGGGTVVSLRWEPLNATSGEQRAFREGHESMEQGWTGTLEQLASHLAELGRSGRGMVGSSD